MKANVTDLLGKTYGNLTVISFDQVKNQKGFWLCRCACGNITSVPRGDLSTGHTLSCGCLNRMISALTKLTHGESKKTKEYTAWVHMKGRCTNKNDSHYCYYGGKGITVCERWSNSYENFLMDMGRAPTQNHSLDRKNVHGDYEPTNCRWATPIQQANNTTRNCFLSYNGEIKTISEWAKIAKINRETLVRRLNLGWDLSDALFRKVNRGEKYKKALI
jgi:hypothetical protein